MFGRMAVQPIPPGQPHVIPHLSIDGGAAEAIEFYKRAFGAEQISRSDSPDGKVMHAEVRIGRGVIYVADNFGPPQKPAGVVINLWVTDANATWSRATQAGAKVEKELGDQFWGDRYGQLSDPFGHRWAVSQHVEDLTPDEVERRGREFFAKMSG
jgi:uncharacterized glyoxalase superfamily protein PhnB